MSEAPGGVGSAIAAVAGLGVRAARRLWRETSRAMRRGMKKARHGRSRARVQVAQLRDDAERLRGRAVRTRKRVSRFHELQVEPYLERRAIESEIATAARGSGPIIAGPWLSEVGYEVLYWAPFLRWLTDRWRISPDRLVVVSRGGTASWYTGLSTRYIEMLDLMPPAEFARRNEERRQVGDQKQLSPGAFDRDILAMVHERLGVTNAGVLHPSLMFRMFRRFWFGTQPLDSFLTRTRFARMTAPVIPGLDIPRPYVAVKFYTGAALPNSPEHRRVLRALIRSAAAGRTVVNLDTGLALDEHEDYLFEDLDVVSLHQHLTPQNNLAVQTAAIAGASLYLGTCGSLAWMAPMLGVPTVAVYADDRFLRPHLYVAPYVYRSLDSAPFSTLDLTALGGFELPAFAQATGAVQLVIASRAETPVGADRMTVWTIAAYVVGLIVAAVIGTFLFHTPFAVSDNLGNMLALRSVTLRQLMENQFSARGFLRPFLWANLKIVYDLAPTHPFAIYRAFHLLQVLLTTLLFVRLLKVRTFADWAAALVALAVLIGMHTFTSLVRESFPINTFLSIALYCLVAVSLSASRGGWWVDLCAALLFFVAALTVETGLLVWVCLVAAYIVGYRGVSWRGVLGTTLLLAGYFYLRFGPLAVGAPGLFERSSGYGFGVLEPSQLVERFGAQPIWFYAYNVLTSFVSVLFAEPRAGVWELARTLSTGGDVPPWMIVNVVSSLLTTGILGWFVARRLSSWVRGRVGESDRLVLLFVAVLAGNAAISYPYTKDSIMSPAGVLYAVAAYVAIRELFQADIAGRRVLVGLAIAVLVAVTSSLWVVRVAGLGYNMRYTAFTNRSDWATVWRWLDDQHITIATPGDRQFVEQLENQSLLMRVPGPYFTKNDVNRFFEQR